MACDAKNTFRVLIMVIRVISGKSSIGIITHQGHISKVNANAE